MDMAADDAVHPATLCIIDPRLHEAGDIALGRTTSSFEEFRERPVAQPEALAHGIEQAVAGEDAVVQPVAKLFLHAAEVGDGVVIVAVHDQQAPTISGGMDGAASNRHPRQYETAEPANRPVMVPRNVDDFRAGAS